MPLVSLCFREGKPGVMWPDMHLAANRAMLEHLKKGNMLKGDVEEMIKVSYLFIT